MKFFGRECANENIKILHYCWICHKEHDLSDRDVREYGIKCDSCGGYVVSPSGKVQMRMVPAVKAFLFDDGEKHWIAADSQEVVEEWYKNEWVFDDEMEYKVSELTLDEIKKANAYNFDRQEGEPSYYSVFDLIAEEEKFPCCLVTIII